MSQFRFQGDALLLSEVAANDLDANVGGPTETAGRPCLVTLESGIQALIKIASFTYIEGIPVAVGTGFAENVDPADLVERCPDGIRLKQI